MRTVPIHFYLQHLKLYCLFLISPVPSLFYWSIPNYFFDVISTVAAVPAKLPP